MRKERILISGGSGLIGRKLTELLLKDNYEVAWLSRSRGNGNVPIYKWDIDKKIIDKEAIAFADHIIHLAGKNVFEGKWTDKMKAEIMKSRVKSAELLIDQIRQNGKHINTFISASGIGYYGADTGNLIVDESSPHGNDFISEVVQKWENKVNEVSLLGVRTVIFRIGVVLALDDGALPKIIIPVKLGIGAPLGTGKQFMSWIHINDLCNIYQHAIRDNNLQGVFNAVAPYPVTNREFTQILSKVLNKPFFMPNVPSMVLKMIFGNEKSSLVLGGNKVSSKKLSDTGYKFEYPELEKALNNLLSTDRG
ncbi:MAG: TIGR01777 family oxidoreductase [Cytophagaceae bacterium]